MRQFLPLPLILLSVAVCCIPSVERATSPITAEFVADPEEGAVPLVVTFRDLSSGAITNWHWDFGDGQFSNESAPKHTYVAGGDYNVSLAVMGPGGSDVETKADCITVVQQAISWEEASSYIGQRKLVEGTIVDAYYAEDTKTQPTFLNFHKPYKGYFTCLIWGSDREEFIKQFPPNPETYFLNKRVRVSGLVQEYPKGSGAPEMILEEPTQIKILQE